jgi:hypothetical protein
MGPKSGLEKGGASTVQDEAVGLLHGTRADGDSHPCIPPLKIEDFYLKGSVQRKLRWVENGLNPWV